MRKVPGSGEGEVFLEKNRAKFFCLEENKAPKLALTDSMDGQRCATNDDDVAARACLERQVVGADKNHAKRCRSQGIRSVWVPVILAMCTVLCTAKAHRLGGFSAPPMLRKCGPNRLPGEASTQHVHVRDRRVATCSMTSVVVSADKMGVEVVGNVTSGVGLRNAFAVQKRRVVGEYR